MGLCEVFREAFPWLFEDVGDLVLERLPGQDVKYDAGGEFQVFKFQSSFDAKLFEMKGSIHGVKFDRTIEFQERPNGKKRTWIVLTVRSLDVSNGTRGLGRGPRKR